MLGLNVWRVGQSLCEHRQASVAGVAPSATSSPNHLGGGRRAAGVGTGRAPRSAAEAGCGNGEEEAEMGLMEEKRARLGSPLREAMCP